MKSIFRTSFYLRSNYLNNNEVCGIYAYSVWYHWLQFYKVDFFCSHIVASWEYFERFGGICMYS